MLQDWNSNQWCVRRKNSIFIAVEPMSWNEDCPAKRHDDIYTPYSMLLLFLGFEPSAFAPNSSPDCARGRPTSCLRA